MTMTNEPGLVVLAIGMLMYALVAVIAAVFWTVMICRRFRHREQGKEMGTLPQPSTVNEVTGQFTLKWLVPSQIYAGSWVPRWTTKRTRSEAFDYARELIDAGQTDAVTLHSVEEIT